ncbi:MAG TPA: FtsQ-type POTRA domain-containing protein [Bryobacteraceae bacterium]|nr:FtsQ-type POTRA domain-containing protein [Bryobacteraceae bacterium]
MARKQAAQLDVQAIDEAKLRRPDVDGLRRIRSKPEDGDWRDRAKRILFWTAVGMALGGGAFLYYRADQFLASDGSFALEATLKIDGAAHTARARIDSVFATDIGRSIYLVRLADRRRSLLAIDWVKDASVSRRWPNRIAVRIVERKPVAFLLAPGGGSPALIDGEGVILSLPERAEIRVPVLMGVTREQPLAVRKARIAPFLDLMQDARDYAGQISEVDAADPDNLKVTLLSQTRTFRLWLGSRRYHDRMMNFTKFYGEISRRLPYAQTFDLRLDDRITVPAEANPAPPVAAPAKAARPGAVAKPKARRGMPGGR